MVTVAKEEHVVAGHNACPGCGAALAMRYVLKVLGNRTVLVVAASCWSSIAGSYPASALRVPVFHTAFETAASAAAGIRAALETTGRSEGVNVLAWAGDGGTFDIGLQALSGAAERGDNIIYICYDNEAYMNTGVQRSSATPEYAWTTTTPVAQPKVGPKKDMVAIMAAHRVEYAATASVGYPEDLAAKVARAKECGGTRFIHILSPCPPGWRAEAHLTIRLARLAVETRIFPLYEVRDGENWALTVDPEPKEVKGYLGSQGRFAHLGSREVEAIQQGVDRNWRRLEGRCRACATV